MKIFNKKVIREIKGQKFRSILIIGVIAISLALLTGMRIVKPMLYDTLDLNLVKNNVADGRFTFSSPIPEQNAIDISKNATLLAQSNISDIEGRGFFYTELTYKNSKFPAIVIGVDYPNRLNQLQIEKTLEGKNKTDVLDSGDSCLIETRFAGSFLGQSVNLGDNVSVNFGLGGIKNLTTTGVAQDSDYLYVVDPASGMTLLGNLAVIWIQLDVFQDYVFGGLPLINQILFTVDNRLDKNMTIGASDELVKAFIYEGIEPSTIQFTIFDETQDRTFFDADAGSSDKFGDIFGAIGIIICAVMIFNTLNRIVQSQKKNIGLFLAMGSPRRKIIGHYIKITMILAVLGSIFGTILGYLMGFGMMQMVTQIYSLHYYSFQVDWMIFIYGSAIMLAVAFAFSALSAYPITKTTPREAMSAVFNRIVVKGKTFFERLFGWIPVFKPIHMHIPLREIFLRKKRTVITIFAILTSMMILVVSIGMFWNMSTQLNDNYNLYNTYDVKIVLKGPVTGDDINNILNNASKYSEIESHEKFISMYTRLNKDDKFLTWTELNCYQEDSSLRKFNVIKGDIKSKQDLNATTILIGQSIASKYDLEVGDTIEIGLIGNYSVTIGGLVGELIDYNIFWTTESFNSDNISAYYGFPKGYSNGILLKVDKSADLDDLRVKLEKDFEISNWEESSRSRQSIETLLNSMMEMIYTFILVGVLIEVMFSFSSMYMAFIDRMDDFISLKAMGVKNGTILKMVFWENTILSVFSLILAVPFGNWVFRESMLYMMGKRFYFKMTLPLETWVIVFLLSCISIYFATRRLMKTFKKLNLPDELRNRIIS